MREGFIIVWREREKNTLHIELPHTLQSCMRMDYPILCGIHTCQCASCVECEAE